MRNSLTVAVAAVLFLLISLVSRLPAEYSNIAPADLGASFTSTTIAASGTFTQARAFTALARTVTQSVQVKGTGTSPNFKVEMLVSLDNVTFVKPETGGDLGTFTDANAHIIAVSVPLSIAHKLKFTELGGANSIVITASEMSQ